VFHWRPLAVAFSSLMHIVFQSDGNYFPDGCFACYLLYLFEELPVGMEI
jgi:hypothetical protein